VPARLLPVPDTISDALKPVVGAPLPPSWDVIPPDAAGWRKLAAASGDGAEPILTEIQQKLGVRVQADTIAGVPVFISTPIRPPQETGRRVLMHLHGGGYVLFPGLVGAGEGMMMAGYGGFTVVSVDYRMAPDFPFPAPLDDAMAVWKALLKQHDAQRMAIFGSSAGGGLTLATALRSRQEGVPLPAALGLGSPWVDLTGAGDSLAANAFVDNVLVSNDGWVGAAAQLYAGNHDLRNPLISPIYGDFTHLPPSILTSGTRDLLLSDTVRTHRKLRQAGVAASLQVFEAQSHTQFLTPFAPETEEAFGEIAQFFRAHLEN
jgi:acetyl esterase/lipase